jgi:hypothetical protein
MQPGERNKHLAKATPSTVWPSNEKNCSLEVILNIKNIIILAVLVIVFITVIVATILFCCYGVYLNIVII